MCYKYRNPHDHVFIWCSDLNGTKRRSHYLHTFQDCIDGYYDNYNYCPYCGRKLEVRRCKTDTYSVQRGLITENG